MNDAGAIGYDSVGNRLWSRNLVLIIVINFLAFMNHLMILATFPFGEEIPCRVSFPAKGLVEKPLTILIKGPLTFMIGLVTAAGQLFAAIQLHGKAELRGLPVFTGDGSLLHFGAENRPL